MSSTSSRCSSTPANIATQHSVLMFHSRMVWSKTQMMLINQIQTNHEKHNFGAISVFAMLKDALAEVTTMK